MQGRNHIYTEVLELTGDTTYLLSAFTATPLTARDYQVEIEVVGTATAVLRTKTATEFSIDIVAQPSPPSGNIYVWLHFYKPIDPSVTL